MNILQELESVIALYQFQADRVVVLKEKDQDEADLMRVCKKVEEEYETVQTIMRKTLPFLMHCKDYLVENHYAMSEYEEALDNKGLKEHNQADIIVRLQQKAAYFEDQCERQHEEMAKLLDSLAEKDQLLESQEQRIKTYVNELKEENTALTQQIQRITLKYKNFELIVDDQIRQRQDLETDLGRYSQNQTQLIAIIDKSSKQIDSLNNHISMLEKAMIEKQTRIVQLQQMREYQQKSNLQNDRESVSQTMEFYQESANQVPTEVKLLQLSQQISFLQKPVFYLQEYSPRPYQLNRQSNQQINYSPRLEQNKQSDTAKKSPREVDSRMRRVASNIELSQQKDNNLVSAQSQLQIKHWPFEKGHKLNESFSQIVVGINPPIQNRLENISEHKQQFGSKMIIETQVTDGQWDMSLQGDMKRQQTSDLSHMDPYYIHYLLTVQGIKIQEDEDGIYGILEIDMKQHYPAIIKANLPISKWSDWIRDKLLSIHEELTQQQTQ